MASLFMESGGAATGDLSLWTVTGGTVAASADSVFGSAGAIKCSLGTPAVTAGANSVSGILSDTGTRMSFRCMVSALPPVSATVFATRDSGDVGFFRFRIYSDGSVGIWANGGAELQSAAGIVSANVPFRVAMCFSITSTTVFKCVLYINGALLVTNENTGTLAGTLPSHHVGVQFVSSSWSDGTFGWMRDFYFDNGTDYSDPGNIAIGFKRPYSNGTFSQFVTQVGSGGSGYGTGHAPQVNELPLSQTNGWSVVGSGSSVNEWYNVETLAQGEGPHGAGTVIVDWCGWVYAKSSGSQTAKIIVNSAESNISLTTTATMFQAFAGVTTYPPNSGADVGIKNSTDLQTVTLYEAGVLIAYLQPGAVSMMKPQPRRPRVFAPGLAR